MTADVVYTLGADRRGRRRGAGDVGRRRQALHFAWQGAARPPDRSTGRRPLPHVGRAVRRPDRAVDHDTGERVRARGYAVNAGETEDDVGSVAVAFRDFAGRPAAVAVAAPTSRLTTPRISHIADLMIHTIARALESPAIAQTPADWLRTAAR